MAVDLSNPAFFFSVSIYFLVTVSVSLSFRVSLSLSFLPSLFILYTLYFFCPVSISFLPSFFTFYRLYLFSQFDLKRARLPFVNLTLYLHSFILVIRLFSSKALFFVCFFLESKNIVGSFTGVLSRLSSPCLSFRPFRLLLDSLVSLWSLSLFPFSFHLFP